MTPVLAVVVLVESELESEAVSTVEGTDAMFFRKQWTEQCLSLKVVPAASASDSVSLARDVQAVYCCHGF